MASDRENLDLGHALAARLKALWPGLSAQAIEGFRCWMLTAETPDGEAVAELVGTGAFEVARCPSCRRPMLVMLEETVRARIRAREALSALGDG